MTPFTPLRLPVRQPGKFIVAYHNIQSLSAHFLDLEANKLLLNADCICLTETWLKPDSPLAPFSLEQFTFQHNPRFNCYRPTTLTTEALKLRDHGGVGIYWRSEKGINVTTPQLTNIECVIFDVPEINIIAAVLYRPNFYQIKDFRANLELLISEMNSRKGGKIIMGDFNENVFKSTTILQLFQKYGYKQIVTTATTDEGTLIDHVYVKGISVDIDVIPTYYSHHNALYITI